LPVLKKNVLRLEIAMNHSVRMRIVEGVADGDRDLHRLLDGELVLAVQALSKALTIDIRHYVVQLPVRLAGVEQRKQVGVLQVRRHFDLGQETFRAKDGAQFRTEHLECDASVVFEIAREIDGGHSSTASLALYLISIGECLGDTGPFNHSQLSNGAAVDKASQA
jgi:hypothetical protein